MKKDLTTLSIADARQMLRDLIKERSFQSGAEMKLASGRTSTVYFNMKPTMLDPQGAYLIARLILDVIKDDNAQFVGGLEMGAVPIATAIAAVSAVQRRPVNAFFVRKEAKAHGTQSLIEGLAKDESLADKRLVVVEDVTTTGGSALKAVGQLQGAGATVVRVVTVVDRQEGAREAFEEAGLTFTALLTVADFVG